MPIRALLCALLRETCTYLAKLLLRNGICVFYLPLPAFEVALLCSGFQSELKNAEGLRVVFPRITDVILRCQSYDVVFDVFYSAAYAFFPYISKKRPPNGLSSAAVYIYDNMSAQGGANTLHLYSIILPY